MSDDAFYEQNAQCWRCRMYVPRVEMKYHAGMLYCPICYQDVAEAGGRCQLCGKQLESGEHQVCRECREKKEHREDARRCPKCGTRLEEGICPKCSRGEPGEGGAGPDGEFGHGVRVGSGAGEYRGRERPSGPGIVVCSKCRQHVEVPVWQGGQPYCQSCAEKNNVSLPIKVLRRIGLAKENIREKRGGIRVKLKQSEEEAAKKKGEKK